MIRFLNKSIFCTIAITFLLSVCSQAGASPCDGINTVTEKAGQLNNVIAKQLNVDSIEILQSFSFGGWTIFFVNTHVSDEPFLFYSSDPLTNKYVAIWSGAARIDEEQDIYGWAIMNAPGIPIELAKCFSWHVTKGRTM